MYGYVLQSAAPAGPSPSLAGWLAVVVTGAYPMASPDTVHLCLGVPLPLTGCEGSSIAVLCSVASRVARET